MVQPSLSLPIESQSEPEPTSRACDDGAIDHPDGTVELNSYIFEIDWDEIDPPDGSADAEEIPHEVVMRDACLLLGMPYGSLS